MAKADGASQMANANGMIKIFSKLNTSSSSDGDEPIISNAWSAFEPLGSEVLEVEKLMPSMSTMTPMEWGIIIKGIIREHGSIKASDVLRLILKAASNNWNEAIMRKSTILLTRVAKYGGGKECLNEFRTWLEQTYDVPKELKVERFGKYVDENKMERLVNPVDVIENALGKHELEWEDIKKEKLQNIVANVIRRDASYVKIEKLLERSVGNWKNFLNQEWKKHAQEEFKRKKEQSFWWERIRNNRRRGRRRQY